MQAARLAAFTSWSDWLQAGDLSSLPPHVAPNATWQFMPVSLSRVIPDYPEDGGISALHWLAFFRSLPERIGRTLEGHMKNGDAVTLEGCFWLTFAPGTTDIVHCIEFLDSATSLGHVAAGKQAAAES
ncbi:uncharacterized protein JCM10292_003067 [Rhodotorula paludigena]|uniref:uncharacterized protein n=1 Tax=Rhodotorula paludigena TaxID=86838 RepID=UPI00317902EF